MGKIVLEALEFYSYHGVFDEEQRIGAKYLVDLELELDFSVAAAMEQLEATVDYSKM